MDDILPPQPIEEQKQNAPVPTKKMASKLSPFIALFSTGGIAILFFVIGLAIAFSFIKWREPAPVTYAGGYSGQEDVIGSLDFPSGMDEAATATCIEEYIRSKESNSPFIKEVTNAGEKFIASGKASDANVNPALMLAIANAESSFGTAGLASSHANLHNYFGYTATAGDSNAEDINGKRMKKFATWDEAITEQGQYMRRMYLSEGITTIIGIRNKYAPAGAANDPTGLNSNWVKNVTKTIKEIGQRCPAINIETGSLNGSSNSIVQAALGEVGYHSEGGENCTKFNTVGNHCQFWCATFVTTVYKQAGLNMPIIAGTGGVKNFFSDSGKGHTYIENPTIDKIQKGDIIFVRSSVSASGFHVGIVESTKDPYVQTIEGNRGRGIDDKVGKDNRNISEIIAAARW